jgi:hypothetical protein
MHNFFDTHRTSSSQCFLPSRMDGGRMGSWRNADRRIRRRSLIVFKPHDDDEKNCWDTEATVSSLRRRSLTPTDRHDRSSSDTPRPRSTGRISTGTDKRRIVPSNDSELWDGPRPRPPWQLAPRCAGGVVAAWQLLPHLAPSLGTERN